MARTLSARIPVCDAEGTIVDRADRVRAERLALAPNATAVRRRATGSARKRGALGDIVRILLACKVDADEPYVCSVLANSQSYSHNRETKTNPEKVWTLKRIPASTQDLFLNVVAECETKGSK